MAIAWFYNGTRMANGTLKTVGADNEAQVVEASKKRWVDVTNYKGEFGNIDNQKPDEIVKPQVNTPKDIDYLTVTTEETTKKLLVAKAKQLGLDIDGRSKERDILDAIQEKLKEVK